MVARAPKAAIDLAAAPFLQGQFVVKRITLVGVEFSLVHMKNGRLRLGSEKDAGDDDIIGRINDLINKNGGQSSSLESFAVRDARLAIYDEVTGPGRDRRRAPVSCIRAKGAGHRGRLRCRCAAGGQQKPCHRRPDRAARQRPDHRARHRHRLDLRGLGASATMFDGHQERADGGQRLDQFHRQRRRR